MRFLIFRVSVVFIMLGSYGIVSLQAQSLRCILYTNDNDTIEGQARFKGRIELQNEGFVFIKRDKSEINYPPSAVRGAMMFLSVFDTLRVQSVSKDVVRNFVSNKAINEAPDTHVLLKTDLSDGPLRMYQIYTGIDIIHAPAAPGQVGGWNNGVYTPTTPGQYGGWDKTKFLHADFLSLNNQLLFLPTTEYERNEDLIKYLSDCPLLTDKLKKKRLNPMKKMTKILSIYNHCKPK